MPRGDERSFLEFEAASVNSVLCTSYTGSARRRRGVGIHKEPHHEALELGRVDLPPEVARLGGVVPDVGRVVDECALHASGLETWPWPGSLGLWSKLSECLVVPARLDD